MSLRRHQELCADSVVAALEAQAATMANADNTNRNTRQGEASVARKFLCPTMVPNSEKLMEVFIEGLPRSIEGNVTASKPQTLEEAITITQRALQKPVPKGKQQCPWKSILAEGQERSPRPERSHIVEDAFSSNYDVEDAFSSTNTPDYTLASPDYSLASPGNTSPGPSDDLSKYLLASLAILPFHDDPYMKVMQAYNAISNKSPIPLSQAPIAPPTVLPPSPMFDPQDFFLPEEILPSQK
ncbi:hypothetical protein Tco_1067366 [Tanacetum coccineum]|uniref:Reverse transcriptase domain-containing protein n=1 Tax=Tanacetum coccineum TaxID=301880 RepID=A0ABQ5HDX2_9ASTR